MHFYSYFECLTSPIRPIFIVKTIQMQWVLCAQNAVSKRLGRSKCKKASDSQLFVSLRLARFTCIYLASVWLTTFIIFIARFFFHHSFSFLSLVHVNNSGIFCVFNRIYYKKFAGNFASCAESYYSRTCFSLRRQWEQLSIDRICCCLDVFFFSFEQIIFSFSY